MENIAAAWLMGLDNLPSIEIAAELAQRVEQATRVASDAAGVLSCAAIERDSQPRFP